MNYQHAFHAGNHADVFKHVILLALCRALAQKPAAFFALDSHAGRGVYALQSAHALRTGEAREGIARLHAGSHPWIDAYLDAVTACRLVHGADAYPGSPWLLAHSLRAEDGLALCEINAEHADALRTVFAGDKRIRIHNGDGYQAIKALLPPKQGTRRLARGLVLIDPPYETQLAEFDHALAALHTQLQRWAEGMALLWYPIKQRRLLQPFYRNVAQLPAKSILKMELLVHADDSPLRLNGSGLLLLNAPWQFDSQAQAAIALLQMQLAQSASGADSAHVQWLKTPA